MPKLSSDMQYLIKYLDDKLQSNTDAILQKIDEKDEKIANLEKEVSSLKSTISKLERDQLIQQYEMDDLKFASNKDFLILSGPGVQQGNDPINCIKSTIQLKTGIVIGDNTISEASTITPKNPTSKKMFKFKLKHETKVEIVLQLAEKHPDVYLNEAISPLKRRLLTKASSVKAALPQKIKSVYFRNGLLRINEVGENAPKNTIRSEVELIDYFKKLNFSPPVVNAEDTSC